MSMTQEEIEALMNETSIPAEEETSSDDSIDDILAGIDGVIEDGSSTEESTSEESIDDILAGIDGVVEDGSSTDESTSEESIDDILAGIDGIVEDGSSAEETVKVETPTPKVENDVEKKIDQGVYPLPASSEHQVVNQLNQVAEDSEEKASQIFDVLSLILDENDVVQTNSSKVNQFIEEQLKLLETLNKKFPNIEIFNENIKKAQEAKEALQTIDDTVNNENNKVFEAMEIMQYHDINRQKIERVMAVIKKLADYLNGIFADDSNKAEVQIAKHISGDGQDTVSEDDLDSLISEFNH